MTTTRRWLWFGLASGLALAASGAAAPPTANARAVRAAAPARSVGAAATSFSSLDVAPPNIVFIMADDLDIDLGTMAAEYAPNIHRLIADQGVTLDRYYVSDSLCCPSRTTYLRGQYTHNHGVYTNAGDSGGYAQMRARGLEESTLATWLAAAGYRTGLFGKYINGYPLDDDPAHVPPGWSDFVSPAAGNAYGSYNYTLNDNGTLVRHGNAPEDYITDVIAAKADDFIQVSARGDAPFFAFVVPYAPHNPAEPAPRHAALFPGLSVPRGGSYDEADVGDKPAVIAALPPLSARQKTAGDELYRKRVQSMQAVDELVARVVGTLEATGELANTLVVFTSDNGFHIGQHRLPRGKTTAYEEDIHVPFYARGPGIPAGRRVDDVLIGNVDIAPTLAAIAGAAVPSFVDGRSFAPYLTGDAAAIAAAGFWRQGYLIEQYPFVDERGAMPQEATSPHVDTARAGLLEPPDDVDEGPFYRSHPAPKVSPARPWPAILPLRQTWGRGSGGEGLLQAPQTAAAAPTATYIALRTPQYTYIEHQNGERELYDDAADPYQLTNIVATAESLLLESLSVHARALHTCGRSACRSTEETVGMVIDVPTPTVSPATTSSPASSPTPTSAAAARRAWLPIASNGSEPVATPPPD